MIVGGYKMTTQLNGGSVVVSQHESGWSFHLQGDDALRFSDEWDHWQEKVGDDFSQFLDEMGYKELLQ